MSDKILLHLTLSLQEANWLIEHLQNTEEDTPWGYLFHQLSDQIENEITGRADLVMDGQE